MTGKIVCFIVATVVSSTSFAGTDYTAFAEAVFKAAGQEAGTRVASLCTGSGTDAVKDTICNLGLYLADKDGRRFVQKAYDLSKRSQVFFTIDETLVRHVKGGKYEPFLVNKREFTGAYLMELSSIAGGGDAKAFETILNLCDGADGEMAEVVVGWLSRFILDYPKTAASYWDLFKAHKEAVSLSYDYTEYAFHEKYPASCGGDQNCREVRDLLNRLKDLASAK